MIVMLTRVSVQNGVEVFNYNSHSGQLFGYVEVRGGRGDFFHVEPVCLKFETQFWIFTENGGDKHQYSYLTTWYPLPYPCFL